MLCKPPKVHVSDIKLLKKIVAVLEIGLQWVESRGRDYVKVMQMSSFLNTAKKVLFASRKQKRVTYFFAAP